ncbi:sulfurtransferase [Paenibacillus sp. MBLB4367]|uniref:sulfurtransferase n=1 Tax=Paenibacillus sp. MBLB4367 TaxID=3384767 RepID=UPI0039082766
MSNIVKAEWVRARLGSGEIVIADVRFTPGDSLAGKEAYRSGHIPGAVFLDVKTDLSGPAGEHGGRSPLPEPSQLAEKLGSLGFDRSTPVVVYDGYGGPAAGRLWWLLKYLGHDEAYVLDGGYSHWAAAGLPVTSEEAVVAPRVYEPALRPELLADVNDVKAALGRKDVKLIDARDARQYLGLEAPQDPVAGRIPGAVNAFWKDALGADGLWKPAAEQRERFAGLSPDEEIIVYCGSGVSACPNALALSEAGFANVKLYAGSWSDWISFPNNPIATGNEEVSKEA